MPYQVEIRQQDFAVGRVRALSAIPHIHSHLELIYLAEGSSLATLDNKEFLIDAGDIFLSFPNQIHFYHDQTPPKGFLCIFSPDLFKDLEEIFQSKVPTTPIIKGSLLPSGMTKRMAQLREKNRSQLTLDYVASKGYLLALLCELLPLMPLIPNTSDQDSVKRVMQYCSENYTEPLSLDLLSKNLHLNKYYISHMFRERMHMSFTDFINNLRTEHACNLLKEGENITEVAFSSGFSSIRTFNRIFSQNMGVTPREYLKSKTK